MEKKESVVEEVKAEEASTKVEEKKKLTWKEKRVLKLRKKYLNPVDIKYQGPLSYRVLRIIAWLSMGFAQIAMVLTIGSNLHIFNINDMSGLYVAVNTLSGLSTPLFIIASFGLILSGKKTYLNYVIFYGVAFLALGLGLCILYLRYIDGLFVELGIHETDIYEMLQAFASNKVQVNVFADLFMFTLFHFFLNFVPPKFFGGKKIVIFRLFSILPVAYVITSYILKILAGLEIIHLSFYFYPFFTTKSPLVFLLFVTVSLLMKYRELIFIKLGATKKEYHQFLKTKRNSWAVSVNISILILIFTVVELFIGLIVIIYFLGVTEVDFNGLNDVLGLYGLGQCLALILAIPFILLYSYTRLHKNPIIDIIIPIGGIAFIVLIYLEGFYQMIINLIHM